MPDTLPTSIPVLPPVVASHRAINKRAIQYRLPVLWALLVSLLLHSMGFGIVYWTGLLNTTVLNAHQITDPASVLQAVMLVDNPTPPQPSPPAPLPVEKIEKAEKIPATVAKPKPISKPPSTPKTVESVPVVTSPNVINTPPVSDVPPAPLALPSPPPEAISQTAALPPVEEPPPETIAQPKTEPVVETVPTPPAVVAQPAAAPHSSTSALSPLIGLQAYPYRLPKVLTIHYEANVAGLSGKSVLNFKQVENTDGLGYAADLSTTATILFKKFEIRYTSAGNLTPEGLRPLYIEEKRANGSTIATTVEPHNNRVIISSKEGFIPYEPHAVDLLSMAFQLGINVQTDLRWRTFGVAQDFKVYRPGGPTQWRLQSQGMDTIVVGGQTIQALYVKRIPLDNQLDYEDQQHLWLDPARYGFPVKMRFVDNKGRSADIVMTDWQEQ